MDKFREFWICFSRGGNAVAFKDPSEKYQCDNVVRTIEYPAYEQAQKRIQELEADSERWQRMLNQIQDLAIERAKKIKTLEARLDDLDFGIIRYALNRVEREHDMELDMKVRARNEIVKLKQLKDPKND